VDYYGYTTWDSPSNKASLNIITLFIIHPGLLIEIVRIQLVEFGSASYVNFISDLVGGPFRPAA